jgi:hypothetical protein
MTYPIIVDTSILHHQPSWMQQTRGAPNPPSDPRAYPRPLPQRAVTPDAAGAFISSPEGHPKENDHG